MDIFGFILDNSVKFAIGATVAATGSFAVTFLAKQAIVAAKNIIANLVADFLGDFVSNRNNQRLALEVVRWVEIKLPASVGITKKQAAIRALRAAVPALSESDADELVEFGVRQINSALKQIETNIAGEPIGSSI